MSGRGGEITETVGRKKIDVIALHEVCDKNEGAKTLREGGFEYRKDRANGDVGLKKIYY